MVFRIIQLSILIIFGGCASRPPDSISTIGGSEFQEFVKSAYQKPTLSFKRYQFYSASKGDEEAIKSLFNQTLYYLNNPLLEPADEVATTWEIQAVLMNVGEDRFLSILETQYPEIQKAVLAPMDGRMLHGAFPKVSKLRAKYWPGS